MKISQAEARRLRRDLNALKALRDKERNGFVQEWPEGVFLFALVKGDHVDMQETEAVRCVRKMGHPVMVIEKNGDLQFYGAK